MSLTTSSISQLAALTIWLRFSNTCLACEIKSEYSIWTSSGLSGICPEMKKIFSPKGSIACEYGPMAAGARLLFISFFIVSLLVVTGLSCLY